MSDRIEIGDQAFLHGSEEEFGAIRNVARHGKDLTVFVENAGDFIVHASAVVKVTSGKVTFDPKKLDAKLLAAIGHAHDAEKL